ncbi:putative transcriptional regulator [Duganella sp. 1411]|uniref:BrnA antitoxin family protein n=1 Tax=Duganella sp. 1411 TaxID=2806572 RepID=UPI001AEBA076|nr:BrnA antitoxin family protein [Duganella sp. 1411]MBP1204305.1 putative transcriptional regulator [Duganella sp. 1411]
MSSEKDQFQRDLLESVKQMRAGDAARVTVIDTPSATMEISLQLPKAVIDRWKATGPDWQIRMAEVLSNASV